MTGWPRDCALTWITQRPTGFPLDSISAFLSSYFSPLSLLTQKTASRFLYNFYLSYHVIQISKFWKVENINEMEDERKNNLIQKYPRNVIILTNNRTIMCLLLTWKIPTEKVREWIYNSFVYLRPFIEEEKGCHIWTIRKNEKLYRSASVQYVVDRDEIINYLISEYIKLLQCEYKSRYDWVRKSSPENCARNCKGVMIPNGIYTNQNLSLWMRCLIFWYFAILPRILDIERINNKEKSTCRMGWLCRPCRPQRENQRKWKESSWTLPVKQVCDHNSHFKWCALNKVKRLGIDLDELKIGKLFERIRTMPLLRLARILRRI